MDLDFIQIGAHVGATENDPLHGDILSRRLRGILVEPIDHLFSRLKQNYQGIEGLYFEKVAISESAGFRTMYRVDARLEDQLPSWASQLASFDRSLVAAHGFGEFIVEEIVRCTTLAKLIEAYDVRHLDFLVIDAEGYDDRIILQLLDLILRPRRILYEHKHLGPQSAEACLEQLTAAGYDCRPWGSENTMAIWERG